MKADADVAGVARTHLEEEVAERAERLARTERSLAAKEAALVRRHHSDSIADCEPAAAVHRRAEEIHERAQHVHEDAAVLQQRYADEVRKALRADSAGRSSQPPERAEKDGIA